MNRAHTLSLSVIVAAVPAAAQAQAPAAGNRSLDVTIISRSVYDSNIARSSEAVAEARGLKREDLRLTSGLAVELAVPVGRTTFYADGEAGYDLHIHNTRLDRERLLGRAGVRSMYGRCVGALEGSISRQQTELQDIFAGPVDSADTQLAVVADVSCSRDAGFYPSISAARRSTENSNVLRETADSNVTAVEGGLHYSRPRLGTAAATLAYRVADFPNRPILTAGGQIVEDGYEVIDAGLRFTRNLGSLVRGTVWLGYTNVHKTFASDGFSGITYAADLKFLSNARLQPRIVARKSVEPSNRIGVLYQVEELLRAEALYRVSPFTRATVFMEWRAREYDAAALAFEGFVSEEDIYTISGAVDVRLTEKIEVSVFTVWEQREADVPLFDYVSTRVGLSGRLAF